MKKLLVCMSFFLLTMAASAQDPIIEVIKAGIKKAIVAVDLKIQRLQTKTIWLQNAQKVIENAMSKLKLDQITDWVQKQKDLYQEYFDELWKVKDVLSYYHRIKEITQQEISESVKNLDQIALVINSFTTQMTDAKRLDIINKAADVVQQNYDDLQQFNSQNIRVSMQRSKDEHDIDVVKQLYSLQ